MNVLDSFQTAMKDLLVNEKEKKLFQKMQSLFFLGHLVGLPTLQSILTKFDIPSNSLQVNYKKLCKSLTINKLRKIFEYIFEYQMSTKLAEMSQKDSSIWSKTLVTVVIDDSIFKQWLQTQCDKVDFKDYYGCFFSGQYKASVYGFKVLTLAVSIDGLLYPLYFEFVKKTQKDASQTVLNKENEALGSAKKIVKRWAEFKKSLEVKGICLPNFHLSCDNGYSDKTLAEVCATNHLVYISVPKKNHYFEFDKKKIKLSTWIETVFLEEEKTHQDKEKDLAKEQRTAFVLRKRAYYITQNQEVTLLAFRLNGSDKISVIYSPDKNIFAKTLRRHWFQRTYIEQFFKMLKHVLQISEARVRSKDEFENKLLGFSWIALQAQKLVRFLRKKIKEFARKGLIALQRILNTDSEYLDLLQNYL